ncbi:MAG: cation transporter [Planctomycetota bacterium]|nr:cation transporter [Planctomycetota bacterium]
MIPLRVVIAPAVLVAAALAACSKVPVVTYATRTVEIPVEGMTCTGCEGTIGSTVLALKGVDACQASFEKKLVKVTYEPAFTDEAHIAEAIRSVGYEVPGTK